MAESLVESAFDLTQTPGSGVTAVRAGRSLQRAGIGQAVKNRKNVIGAEVEIKSSKKGCSGGRNGNREKVV